MDKLSTCILQIYRAAQDSSIDEFQRRLFSLVRQTVAFRSGTWCNDSGIERGSLSIGSIEAFNEPDDIVVDLPIDIISKEWLAALQGVANQPRTALATFAPDFCASKHNAELRNYLRRYGHEHNMIVADIETPKSLGTWLALCRPLDWGAFDAQDQRALTLLMPHLVEARTINRRLTLSHGTVESRGGLEGTRALINRRGTLIHAGFRFRALLNTHWPDEHRARLPAGLLSELQRRGSATLNGSFTINASPLGELQQLSMHPLPVSPLSNRETEVLRLMSKGLSLSDVSTRLEVSTHTVVAHTKRIYRKLAVHSRSEAVYEARQRGLL